MAMKMYGLSSKIHRAPCKFQLDLYGGPLSIEDFRMSNQSSTFTVTNVPNITYSNIFYDVYLNNDVFTPDPPQTGRKRKCLDVKEKKSSDILDLKRMKTPAYQTKMSLMNILNKTQKLS
tara:strand:- start:978 stop:1334 length:357 start_codon:yes stop_codon:yes gene_type:complete